MSDMLLTVLPVHLQPTVVTEILLKGSLITSYQDNMSVMQCCYKGILESGCHFCIVPLLNIVIETYLDSQTI